LTSFLGAHTEKGAFALGLKKSNEHFESSKLKQNKATSS